MKEEILSPGLSLDLVEDERKVLTEGMVSSIEKINLENMKINPDTVEKNDIADILNSAPIDTNAHDDGK